MTEAERTWIAAARRGDVDAFNQLVRMYEGRVYNLACRMLGDRDAAADIAQETFISAYRSIGRFRDGAFGAWLLRIATNACYDALRAMKRRPSTSFDAMIEATDDGPGREFANDDTPLDERVLTQELSAEIQAGLLALPDDQRAVVILADIQGYAYEEIAAITDAQLGTVKSRLSRGRAKLRDYLRARELLPSQYR